jgi:MbtH protein
MFDDDSVIMLVVINEEEQYSIWPEFKTLPHGWRAAGKSGTRSECLAYIREVWTDMRPASLRRILAEAEAKA